MLDVAIVIGLLFAILVGLTGSLYVMLVLIRIGDPRKIRDFVRRPIPSITLKLGGLEFGVAEIDEANAEATQNLSEVLKLLHSRITSLEAIALQSSTMDESSLQTGFAFPLEDE